MAGNLELKLVISADGKVAVAGINEVEQSVTGLGTVAEETEASTSSLGESLAKLGLGAVSIAALTTALKGWVDAANIQSRAETQLAQTMKNVGGATDEEIAGLKQLASALQDITGYGDEATIGAQAFLGTFGLSAKEVAKLTPALLDTAEAQRRLGATGLDLQGVAQAIGKAFTDGVTSLRRYGVTVTDATAAQFDAATGMERTNILVKILNDNFGGLAAAVGKDFEGATRKATGAQGDLAEALGRVITQSTGAPSALGSYTDALKSATAWVDANAASIRTFIGDAGLAALPAILAVAGSQILSFAQALRTAAAGASTAELSVRSLTSATTALQAGFTTLLGYEVGRRLRDFGDIAKYVDATVNALAGAIGLDVDAVEALDAAQSGAAEADAKRAESLKAISTATGVAVRDMADLNAKVATGELVWNAQLGVWEKGVNVMSGLAQGLGAVDTAYARLADILEASRKAEADRFSVLAAEAKTSAARAKLIGDEAGALAALDRARQIDVDAADRQVVYQRALLADTEARIAQLLRETATTSAGNAVRNERLRQLQDEEAKGKTALAASVAAAAQARVEADQARLAVATYGDQSKQVDALSASKAKLTAEIKHLEAVQVTGAAAAQALAQAEKNLADLGQRTGDALQSGSGDAQALAEAYRAAALDVDLLRGQIAAGAEAETRAAAARQELADTTARLIDATKDLVDAEGRELAATERNSTALDAASRLRETHLQNLANEAKTRKDLDAQMRAEEDLRGREISDLQAAITAKRAEVSAAEALVTAKQQAAAADNDVTAAEQEEIAQAQALVEAKKLEVQVLQESKRAKEADAEATRTAADATTEAATGTTAAVQATQQAASTAGEATQVTLASTARALGIAIDGLGQYQSAAETAFNAAAAASVGAFNAMAQAGNGDGIRRLERQNVAIALAAAAAAKASDDLAAAQSRLSDAYGRGDIGLTDYIAKLQQLESSSTAALGSTAVLGEQDLRTLRNAIADAKAQMQSFTQSASDGLAALQVEWANLNGDAVSAERIRAEQAIAEIQTKILQAQKDGNQEALAVLQQQLAIEQQIAAKKIADARAEAAAAGNTAAGTTVGTGSRATTTTPQRSGTVQVPASFGGTTNNIAIHIAGVLDVNDRATLTSLATKLAPVTADLTRRGML